MMAPTCARARVAAAAAVLVALAAGAAAQNNFNDCVTSQGTTYLRTPDQPDFMYHVQNSIYPDPTPYYIAAVKTHADVEHVMKCANQFNVKVCPRSGGHSFVGGSSCNGVMVDLRDMQGFSYNPANQQITISLGHTLGELFFKTLEATNNQRLIGVGLCPSVGTGGYFLGGGHNPYAGKTGLTCDSLTSIKIVKPDGTTVVATPNNAESELFWASCGGGGGIFGVAVEGTLNTHDASPFHNNVYFRYSWPATVAGDLISKWLDWDQNNGETWMRLEATIGGGMFGYGVCWNSGSTGDCFNRLNQQPFFSQTPGRVTNLIEKADDVKAFQAFIGPAGNWANNKYEGSYYDAFVNKVYLDRNAGSSRRYGSSFFSWPSGQKPSVAAIQNAVDSVAGVDQSKVNWLIFQWNPWSGSIKNNNGQNAFAHRNSNAFVELIGDSKSGDAGLAELARIEQEVKFHTRTWFSGIYVSYPEFELPSPDYQYLYWGQNLQRLANLRAAVDPNDRMDRLQPLPSGTLQCPGALQVYTPGSSNQRALQITGYTYGQMADMVAVFSVNGGCGVNTAATQGANVQNNGDTYSAIVHTNSEFTITLTGSNTGACSVSTVSVNGISCNGESPAVTTPAVTTPAVTQSPPSGGSGTPVLPPNGAQCTPLGARCIGAPGKPAVPWLGGCCSGPCVDAPDWGMWCPSTAGATNAPTVTEAPSTLTPVMPPDGAQCTPLGARCIGAAGKPAVPWLGGCCSGPCNDAPDWGKWCPPAAGATDPPTVTEAPATPAPVTQAPPTQAPGTGGSATPVMPPDGAQCTPLGARCIGAPGKPAVPWLGGCCSGPCVDAPDWGMWCPSTAGATNAPTVTEAPSTLTPVMPPDGAQCTPLGARCIGAAGKPAVPWLGGCCSGPCNDAPDWGKWCPPTSS